MTSSSASYLFVVRVPVEDADGDAKKPGSVHRKVSTTSKDKTSVGVNVENIKTDSGKVDEVKAGTANSVLSTDEPESKLSSPEEGNEKPKAVDNVSVTEVPPVTLPSVAAVDTPPAPSNSPGTVPTEVTDPPVPSDSETSPPGKLDLAPSESDPSTPPPWDFSPIHSPETIFPEDTKDPSDKFVFPKSDDPAVLPAEPVPSPPWQFPDAELPDSVEQQSSDTAPDISESPDSTAKFTVEPVPEKQSLNLTSKPLSTDDNSQSPPNQQESSNQAQKSPAMENQIPAEDKSDEKEETPCLKSENDKENNPKQPSVSENTSSNPKDSELKLDNTDSKEMVPETDKEEQTTGEKDVDKKEEDPEKDLEVFVKKESQYQQALDLLEGFAVGNLTVQKTTNGKFFQFVFIEEGERCEDILNKLAEIGIGDGDHSSISIFQTTIFKGTGKSVEEPEEEEALVLGSADNAIEQKESEFKKSIKARMLVSEVVNSVQGNAEFTFDFLLLIILASSISALGLVENSSVVLVASMLVSPIMGPILAGTFGSVIQNKFLRNLGIKNEIKSLLICVAMGMLWGLVCGGVCKDGANWGSTDSWPTSEMKSRGLTRSLWTGVLIAVPSGAGVALSVLGGNTGSLVGVAISASLLPPAVNAGMLWVSAIISVITPPPRVVTIQPAVLQNNTPYNITQQTNSSDDLNVTVDKLSIIPAGLNCAPFVENTYVPEYSCNMAEEMLYLGLVSLALTILNIICIVMMGILVLKVKEVAPQIALSDETKEFWREDIKIAKESYMTMKGNQTKNLSQEARDLVNEWRKENGDAPIQLLQLERLTQEVDDDPGVQDIQMRIHKNAGGNRFSRHVADYLYRDNEMPLTPEYKTFHTFHGSVGHPWRSQRWNSFNLGSGTGSTASVHRRKVYATSFEKVNEENVPLSADGPLKREKAHGRFTKAFGILRHPRAGRSNLFRRRQKDNETEEKKIRFAVEKVSEDEVKDQIVKGKDKDVAIPLLESV